MKKIKRTIEVEEWSETCPHCGQLIEGSSENHCKWNLAVHIMAKHKDITKKQRR